MSDKERRNLKECTYVCERDKKKKKKQMKETSKTRDEIRMYECEYRAKIRERLIFKKKKKGKKRKSIFVFCFSFASFSSFCILSSDFLA